MNAHIRALIDDFNANARLITCTVRHPNKRWFLDKRLVQQVFRVDNHGIAWLDANAGHGPTFGHHYHKRPKVIWISGGMYIVREGKRHLTFKPAGSEFERPDEFMDREEGREFLASAFDLDAAQIV